MPIRYRRLVSRRNQNFTPLDGLVQDLAGFLVYMVHLDYVLRNVSASWRQVFIDSLLDWLVSTWFQEFSHGDTASQSQSTTSGVSLVRRRRSYHYL